MGLQVSRLGALVTTWNYDTNRGWLINKRYDNNQGPDYTYTAGGGCARERGPVLGLPALAFPRLTLTGSMIAAPTTSTATCSA